MSYPVTYKIGPVHQGSTFKRRFTWLVSNEPIDLTGWSARMDIRETADSTSPTVSATTTNGYISLGGDECTIDINIPASIMEDVPPGRYVYDLELVSSSSPPEVTAIVAGQFVVSAEVTR